MMNMPLRSIAVWVALVSAPLVAQQATLAPINYTREGKIPLPEYRKWVFIGSGAFDTPQTAHALRFSNVFVSPAAYDSYMATGIWPDRTVILSEKRTGATTVPITANPGWGQTGEPTGFEFEVKDAQKGGWRYFTAGPGDRAGTPVANQADCTTCHAAHAAVDNTFVQFYPSLVAAAQRHGTFKVATQ